MKKLTTLFVLLICSGAARGHHSFSVEFDSEKIVTVSGIVSEVRFRNPHVQYFLEVDVDGEVARWIIAGHTILLMKRSGMTADTVSVGDQITITGYAGRNGAKKVYLETLDTAAGEKFTVYGDAVRRAGAVTETRTESDPTSSLLAELPGDWAFDVDKELPGAPLHLRFERDGSNLRAILDNEVIDVTVGGESFSMILDRENLAGFPAKLKLIGRIVDGAIEGDIEMTVGFTNYPELDAETFSAMRTSADFWKPEARVPMAPVDFTGVWERSIILGPIGRTNAHLNAAGKARHKEFQKGAYDPLLRCMSAGPMRRQARRGNMEILATTNRLTLLYANGNGIRRIWFDRKEHTVDRVPDSMGESIATWDGSTLVIDTRNLSASVLTQNLEPISSNARIVERLWLNDNNELVMEATLHDPTYYERPVVKRLQWTRSEDQEMMFPPCDPDSFYRSLQFDGELDSYFEHQPSLGEQ
jgi:hypothetical protein